MSKNARVNSRFKHNDRKSPLGTSTTIQNRTVEKQRRELGKFGIKLPKAEPASLNR